MRVEKLSRQNNTTEAEEQRDRILKGETPPFQNINPKQTNKQKIILKP